MSELESHYKLYYHPTDPTKVFWTHHSNDEDAIKAAKLYTKLFGHVRVERHDYIPEKFVSRAEIFHASDDGTDTSVYIPGLLRINTSGESE